MAASRLLRRASLRGSRASVPRQASVRRGQGLLRRGQGLLRRGQSSGMAPFGIHVTGVTEALLQGNSTPAAGASRARRCSLPRAAAPCCGAAPRRRASDLVAVVAQVGDELFRAGHVEPGHLRAAEEVQRQLPRGAADPDLGPTRPGTRRTEPGRVDRHVGAHGTQAEPRQRPQPLPERALQPLVQGPWLPLRLRAAYVLPVDEELQQVGDLVERRDPHWAPPRLPPDHLDELGIGVAVAVLPAYVLGPAGKHLDHDAGSRVAAPLPDDQVRGQVLGGPPLAQGGRLRVHGEQLVGEANLRRIGKDGTGKDDLRGRARVVDNKVLGKGLRVLGYAIRGEPRLSAVAVAGSTVFSLLTIGTAYVVGAIIGHVVVPAFDSGRVAIGALVAGAAAILGVSLGKVLALFGRRLGAGAMQFRLQATYRRRVTRRYLRLPLAWHHRHATGTLLSNANADVEAAWYPIAPLPFAVGTVVMLVAAVAALFATDWVLALVGLAVFPSLLSLNVVYSRRMAPRVAHAQQLRAEVSAIAHESFDGALVVKTMGREAEEAHRFGTKARELRDAMVRVGRVRGLFDPMLDALPSLGTLAVLVVGAWRLRQGAVTVAEVVSVAFLFTVLAFPVRAIGWVLAELPRSVVGWERVYRVVSATGDMTYGRSTLDGHGTPATPRRDHVDYAYPDGSAVLHDVTFEVPAGRTVALVGPTGSGKSTIASLAGRLVDPTAGTVSLDGVDARTLDQEIGRASCR